MTAEPSMWDPVRQLILDLREDSRVAAIAGANPTRLVPRVSGQEAGPGDVAGPEAYRAHIVVVTLGLPRHASVPVQRARHAVRCYGRTIIEAGELYYAASDALHGLGGRLTGDRHAIYITHDDTGGEYSTDPDTKQPLYTFIVETVATTQVLA